MLDKSAYLNFIKILKKRNFLLEHTSQTLGTLGSLTQYIDYGHLGLLLKNNIKSLWWNEVVLNRNVVDNCYGIETNTLNSKLTLVRSGHVERFSKTVSVDRLLKQPFDYGTQTSNLDFQSIGNNLYKIYIYADEPKKIYDQNKNTIFNNLKVEFENSKIILFAKQIIEPNSTNHIGEMKLLNIDNTTVSIPYYGKVFYKSKSPFLTYPKEYTDLVKVSLDVLNHDESLTKDFNLDKNQSLEEMKTCYLRPELAQGIFINYKNYIHNELPFGIAQVGKSFRNEIRPQHLLYKTIEFDQMELEIFVDESREIEIFKHTVDKRESFWNDLVFNHTKVSPKRVEGKDLAHYAKSCTDLEFEFPFGICELEGIANRGNYDLTQHFASNDKLGKSTQKKYPSVIEASCGLSRSVLAVLVDSFKVNSTNQDRVFLNLRPKLAPIKVAIIPIVNKEKLLNISSKLRKCLINRGLYSVINSQGSSIGKKYKTNDEIGTLFCISIDSQTIHDSSVMIRDRNTTQQKRININEVLDLVENVVYPERKFEQI